MTAQQASFDKEFKAALAARGANTEGEIYSNCMKVLEKFKLVYKLESVHPRFFLTHKYNRGGLMLSPHNAHRNAEKLYLSRAADKTQLINAVCFELPPSGATRDMHVEANKKLIDRSNGFLAPLTGDERYVTVGCGHTVAFCKNAAIGGKTPSFDLQDDSGNIDKNKIGQHEVFASMVNEGWNWQVINSKVDVDYPEFAKVAQKTLNISNHIASEMSELETAKILADSAADRGFTELEDWKSLAVANVRALSVPCAGYANHILNFVQYYAGGENAPLIHFLDDIAKQFHCNVNLGETFWYTISQTMFYDQTKQFPLLRVAFALTNLTSDKVEDGISRLLVKTDFTRLATKAAAAEADETEQILQDGLDIVDKVSSRDMAMQALGQFFVRVVLKVTKKEKMARDPTQRSMDEIKAMFLNDLSKIVGKTIEYSRWNTKDVQVQQPEAAAATAASSTSAAPMIASLEDHANAAWVAEQHGFSIGQYVLKKGTPATDPESVFVVFAVIDQQVTLKQVCTYHGQLAEVTVDLRALLKEWATTKTDLPRKMASSQQRPKTLAVDVQKSIIFKALVESDPKTIVQSSLVFWRKPDSVRAGANNIAEGTLVLAPMMPLMNVTTKASPSAVSFGKFKIVGYDQEVEFFGLPPPKPPADVDDGADTWPAQYTVAAFWWVEETSVKKLVNMVEDVIEKNGITIPVLNNSVVIEAHAKLYKYKPAAPKKKVAAAVDNKAAASKPAAKRSRGA